MRRKLLALAMVALALLSVMPPGMAVGVGTGTVIFESGAPDADGVFQVTMKVQDTTVWGIQFALKYDPAVIQPVDAQGDPAQTLADFAGVVQPWTEVVNEDFYPERGLLGSAWITSLDATGDQISQYGDTIVGSEPLDVFTFRFKRLAEGDTGLEIATEAKGEPFQDVIPEGLIAMSMTEDLIMDVIFREADSAAPERSETIVTSSAPSDSSSSSPAESTGAMGSSGTTDPDAPEAGQRTPEALLEQAVMLKIGSHAAVVKGSVTAIYPGEREVTAYAHDNRTFVPVRFVGERLGATVGWDNETQTATVEKDGHRVEMAIGSSTFTLDGASRSVDAPAELTPSVGGNFRTMVPIRFVSEALGYQVEWDQARDLVVIVPTALGWDKDGQVEAQAMDQAILRLSMYSMFV